MRAFFALGCSGDVRRRLGELANELREFSSLKLVKPENYHITVKFLGEITDKKRSELDSGLQRSLPPLGPLGLPVRNVGVFPNLDRPSVIWAGVEPIEPLQELFESVEDVATNLGFDPEEREFHPHLTLARVKGRPNNKSELVSWIQDHGLDSFGRMEIDSLALYESDLTSKGPVYSELESWPL